MINLNLFLVNNDIISIPLIKKNSSNSSHFIQFDNNLNTNYITSKIENMQFENKSDNYEKNYHQNEIDSLKNKIDLHNKDL